ncbi:phosphoenolpyruvate carboxykinase, partial [Bacteroides xylanisolvens]
MRNEYFFRVAGLLFSVSLPSGWDAEALLPSFRPFRCGACPEGKRLFRLLAATL